MADSTSSSVEIGAEPGAVLDVIADFDAYPEWTGEMKEVTVLAEDGDGWPDRVRFVLDAGPIKDTYVLEYDWDVDETGAGVVSWTLVEASIIKTLDGSYTLAATGSGSTTVTYDLTVDVKIPMLGMLKRKAEKTIIDTALKGLKKRVEG
jgi:hypothetical protein